MSAIQCGRCYRSIALAADGRMPPWCPQCGASMKENAAPPTNVLPEHLAVVAAAVTSTNAEERSRLLDAFDAGQPLSRAYRHVSCGQETLVSGDDYVLLECPFRPVESTLCCGCQKLVLLNEVRWVDTDEKVSTYRERVKASVPWWRRIWLTLFANAYQGAVNLRLDSRGRPLRTASGSA